MFDDPFLNAGLSSFFGRDLSDVFERNPNMVMPAVNIKETDNNFQIEVAAPGLRKEDFSIQLDKNVLTLSAQRETSSGFEPGAQQQQAGGQAGGSEGQTTGQAGKTEQGGKQKTEVSKQGGGQSTAMQTGTQNQPERYTRREFSYTSFQRSFTLPETVDAEKITANYQDGILLVTVPKRQQAQVTRTKTINIS
jgi:HSP20 family protein